MRQPVTSTSAADVTVWSADMQVVEYGTGSIGAGTADLFSNQQGRAGLRAKWLWYDPPARAEDRLRRRPGRPGVADPARRRRVGGVSGEHGRQLELHDRGRRCLVDRRRDAGGAGVEAVGGGGVDRYDAGLADGVGCDAEPGLRRRGAGVPGGGRRGHDHCGGDGDGRRRGGGVRAGRGRRRGIGRSPGGGARRRRGPGRSRGHGGGRHGAPLPRGAVAGGGGGGGVERGADRPAGDRRDGQRWAVR